MTSFKIIFIFLLNFLYGILFLFLSLLNYKLFSSEDKIIKSIIYILFIFDNAIIYLIILYKINYGVFHIYYFIYFIIGFIFAYYIKNKVLSLCKKIKNKKWLVDLNIPKYYDIVIRVDIVWEQKRKIKDYFLYHLL